MSEINKKRKIIGERIRVIRNELGLTMNEFGKKFTPPASDSIVSRWERGVSSPNNERLKRIAEIGNISMLYLTTGKKGIMDLSQEEKNEAIKGMRNALDKIENEEKDFLKEELRKIQIDNLDRTTLGLLTEMFYFLKWTDANDKSSLFTILSILNDSPVMKENDKITQDEIKEHVKNKLDNIIAFIHDSIINERIINKEGE